MISHIQSASVVLADQDAALDFCVNTLGWEKAMDAPAGPEMRRPTVVPPGATTQLVLAQASRAGRASPTRDGEQGGSMPRPMTEQERQAFLAEPRVAVLSVARGDDRPPHATPVWYGYRPGGEITFFTGTQGRKSRKTDLIQNAGVLSLTVQRADFPYRYVTVEGTVVRADRPPSAEQALAVVRRYLPEDQARGFVEAELAAATTEFVLFTVRPDRWLTFDFGDADGSAAS
jgi:nitroimidazol reductase NimA-like FMN-containing flavoprotein (pyridoxamine 5'-phosphate oxidase superfamily)